jgi:hypothetical protein
MLVVETLDPRYQAQTSQNLRLDPESYIEVLYDVVYSKRDSSPSPEHHHGRLETSSIVPPVVDNYLRDELDRPTNL